MGRNLSLVDDVQVCLCGFSLVYKDLKRVDGDQIL